MNLDEVRLARARGDTIRLVESRGDAGAALREYRARTRVGEGGAVAAWAELSSRLESPATTRWSGWRVAALMAGLLLVAAGGWWRTSDQHAAARAAVPAPERASPSGAGGTAGASGDDPAPGRAPARDHLGPGGAGGTSTPRTRKPRAG
jgi:hypothetical protein